MSRAVFLAILYSALFLLVKYIVTLIGLVAVKMNLFKWQTFYHHQKVFFFLLLLIWTSEELLEEKKKALSKFSCFIAKFLFSRPLWHRLKTHPLQHLQIKPLFSWHPVCRVYHIRQEQVAANGLQSILQSNQSYPLRSSLEFQRFETRENKLKVSRRGGEALAFGSFSQKVHKDGDTNMQT